MDFGSGDNSSTAGQLPPGALSQNKEQIMGQVRQELAVANAQELMTKMNDKCFEQCIPKPGSKLTSSEQTCLVKCMDKYMDTWNVVSKTYHSRMQRESSNAGMQ